MEDRFQLLTANIAKMSRYIKRIKSEEMADIEAGLKGPHVSCLYYIYKSNGTMTAKEITEVCDEDKAAISRSLDSLEKEGYISCESKTEKRYKSLLFLTEQGKVVATKIAEKVDNIVNVASADMNIEERAKFYKNLTTISNNLQKICDKYGE